MLESDNNYFYISRINLRATKKQKTNIIVIEKKLD